MKNIKPLYYTCLLLCLAINVKAQKPVKTTNSKAKETDKETTVPRMTTRQRDAIIAPAQGLMVYNTQTQCLDIYNATENVWKSNCGDEMAAIYNPNCNTTIVNGNYFQGVGLNPTNVLIVEVNVERIGMYTIFANSNSMVFGSMGIFTKTGIQTVVLKGKGIPEKKGKITIPLAIGETLCNTTIIVKAK